MRRIKSGELFVFQTNLKYGLLQVIEKSKISGYNVRVFYDLFDEIKEEIVEEMISRNRFYFIKDFYENDLMMSQYRIPYNLSTNVKMPKYMRASERKSNGDLIWYIIDVVNNKVVKTISTFDEELANLSPARTWGIEYIKKRWIGKFTLNTWNDELENVWYLEYLKTYEPQNVEQFNLRQIKNHLLIKTWKKDQTLSKSVTDTLECLIECFIKKISKNSDVLNESITQFIMELNILNDKYSFIDTQKSEELIELIYDILGTYNLKDTNDIIDKVRKW